MPQGGKQSNLNLTTVRRVLELSGRQKTWFYLAVVVDLAQAAIIILSNHYMRGFFDAASLKNQSQFWYFLMLSLTVSVMSIPLSYVRTYGIGLFSERTLAKIRQSIAARATVLPVGYLEERHSGDVLSVINADLGKLKSLTSSDLIQLLGLSVRGVAALIYIISINWKMALVSTISTPLIFIVVSVLTSPITKRTEEMQTEIGKVNSVAQDGLGGVMVVKSFNLTRVLNDRFHLANLEALKKGLKIAWPRAIIDGVALPLSITPFIIAIGFGGYLAIIGQMTFGGIFAFINLLNFVVNPLSSLPGVFASISEASGAAQRVFQILDHEPERESGLVEVHGTSQAPVLQFDRVAFSYGNTGDVLKDISFEIHKGRTVAIVGPSGSGKSTVLKLILGYYPPQKGRIEVFGQDINDWKLPAVRRQMAFVAQDTYLFPVSIAENIGCGKPGSSQVEIERAAKLANIHDFIMTLPESYATLVGERGARLSGGQKQRISLARAILKDAPILLLDEATSALDTESETLVQEALERFAADRTTVVIAHRLSTIRNADQVVVIDDGRIVEQGTHEELMAKNGLYLDLYQKQFESNLTDSLPPSRN